MTKTNKLNYETDAMLRHTIEKAKRLNTIQTKYENDIMEYVVNLLDELIFRTELSERTEQMFKQRAFTAEAELTKADIKINELTHELEKIKAELLKLQYER